MESIEELIEEGLKEEEISRNTSIFFGQ